MKKPDLLVLIAIWEFVAAFVAFIGIAVIAVFVIPAVMGVWGNWTGYYNGVAWSMGDMPRTAIIFGLSVGMFILLCYMIIAIVGGIGLLAGKEWGRIIAIVHSALSIFCAPIGTVIGILAIVYLTRAEVKEFFIPPPKA